VRHAPCRSLLYLLGALAMFAIGSRHDAVALPIVGNAQTVVREVKGKIETELRTLVVDSDVFLDEEVSTGPNSGTRIVFKDGTNLELGENSRLRLTKLVFDPDPNKSEIAVKALVGVFRWTSGNLPVGNYHVSTSVATIGIRGTSFEWIVGADGTTTIALAKGAITVANLRGDSVDLEPNQATTVYPPDPDGSQLAPTTPGPIPTAILQVIWKMTATINLFDAPSMGDPHAGGSGFIEQTGGYDTRLNPNYFNPSSPGANDALSGPTGTFAPATTIPGQTPSGQPIGGSGTPPVVITPPPVVVTPPPPAGPGIFHIVTPIPFGAQPPGSGNQISIRINTTGLTFNVVIASVQLLGDTFHAFTATGFSVGPADGPLAGLLTFVPPPGMPDQLFTADFRITDALGDTWDWLLTGTEIIASIPEPSTLALFLLGIAALAWTRRRPPPARASAERKCVG
jgi:hypothetical protein